MYVVRVKFRECYVVVMPLVRYVTQESRYLGVAVVLVIMFCCNRVILRFVECMLSE